MKYFFTISLCFLTLSLSSQEILTYPYNPDGNADGAITVPDLQDFLTNYNTAFEPAEILFDGQNLSEVLVDIISTLENLANPAENSSTTIYFAGELETLVVGLFRYIEVKELENDNNCGGPCYRLHLPSPSIVPDGFVITIFDAFGSGQGGSPSLQVYSTNNSHQFSAHTAKSFIKFGDTWYWYE
jgi:hypothetical protein